MSGTCLTNMADLGVADADRFAHRPDAAPPVRQDPRAAAPIASALAAGRLWGRRLAKEVNGKAVVALQTHAPVIMVRRTIIVGRADDRAEAQSGDLLSERDSEA